MSVVPTNPFARKLSAFIDLSDEELGIVENIHQRRKHFFAGRVLVHEGQKDPATYVLVSGWAISYKVQPNGERQIVGIQVPGDILGLRSLLTKRSDQSIEAILSIQAAEIEVFDLVEAFMKTPRVATAILCAASQDKAIVVERLGSIGRRDAEVRIIHLLLELCYRLTSVGLGTKAGYACPLTQSHLADALGMSPVHVNRVLRKLREARMVTFRDGFVTFTDHDRLAAYSRFDPDYMS